MTNDPIQALRCPFCAGHYAMLRGSRVTHQNPVCDRFKAGGAFYLKSVTAAQTGQPVPPMPKCMNRRQRRAHAARARRGG